MANLTIIVNSFVNNIYHADITAVNGEYTCKQSVKFNPRKDTDGMAYIATLNAGMQGIGTATNITLKGEDLAKALATNTPISRASARGVTGGSNGKDPALNKQFKLSDDGNAVVIYYNGKDGNEVVITTISDADVVKHYKLGVKVNTYLAGIIGMLNTPEGHTALATIDNLKALGLDHTMVLDKILPAYTTPKTTK